MAKILERIEGQNPFSGGLPYFVHNFMRATWGCLAFTATKRLRTLMTEPKCGQTF